MSFSQSMVCFYNCIYKGVVSNYEALCFILTKNEEICLGYLSLFVDMGKVFANFVLYYTATCVFIKLRIYF